MLLTYLASLCRRQTRAPGHRRRRPRLTLEELERRLQPSTLLWVGSNGASTTDPNSWLTSPGGVHQAPATGDSLVFDPSQSVNGTKGANTSTGETNPLAGTYANLTVSSSYTGTVLGNSGADRLGITITGSVALQGGRLSAGPDLTMMAGSTLTFGSTQPGTNPSLWMPPTIQAGATMNVQGPGSMLTTVNNYGTVNFQGSGFTIPDGPNLQNWGTVDLQADDSFGSDGNYIISVGYLKKTGGAGTSTLTGSFSNRNRSPRLRRRGWRPVASIG